MTDPERDMAEKLIDAIKDNTKAQRELQKVHSELLHYISVVLPAYFIVAIFVYCIFQ